MLKITKEQTPVEAFMEVHAPLELTTPGAILDWANDLLAWLESESRKQKRCILCERKIRARAKKTRAKKDAPTAE